MNNNNITSTISGITIRNFTRRYNRNNIPSHQRNYVWGNKEENRFIDSIMTLPVFGCGLLISIDDSGNQWIEDGQNRLMCLQKFMRDEFPWVKADGTSLKYSEFTNEQNIHFLHVEFPMNLYSNATISQRIEIFTRHQGGRALVPGELYHSFISISPIIKHAIYWFLDRENPLYERMVAIWGNHEVEDHKRYNSLEIAVALAASVLTGDIRTLSRKYSDIQPLLSRVWTEEEVNRAKEYINRLISIYERASQFEPIPNGSDGIQLKKKQWDIGTFTGYALHGILGNGLLVPEFDERMAEKIAEHRRLRNTFTKNKDKSVLSETFHHGLSSARSWNLERWEHGLRHVFAPEMELPDLPDDESNYSDD